jgi:hypothetical protein
MDYVALKDLMETHVGWPVVDDATLTVWVNEKSETANRDLLSSSLVFATIASNVADYQALAADQKVLVMDILKIHSGEGVPVAPASPARSLLVNIFGGGSDTIQSLAAELTYPVSRAFDAGITEAVLEAHVQKARAI